MLGPLLVRLLVHQKMDFAAYFTSSLNGIKEELKTILAFGTDGNKVPVEAFTHNFHCAIQLRCFVHFKNNVHEKLKSLGLSAPIWEEFISDIFGKWVGNTFQEGLVDISSAEEFDDHLHRFQPIHLSISVSSRLMLLSTTCKDLHEAALLPEQPSPVAMTTLPNILLSLNDVCGIYSAATPSPPKVIGHTLANSAPLQSVVSHTQAMSSYSDSRAHELPCSPFSPSYILLLRHIWLHIWILTLFSQ